MTVLLDTHVLLWMLDRPERLPDVVQGVLTDPAVTVFVSAATVWEIGIKHATGKLTLPDPPDVYVPTRMVALGFAELPIDHVDAIAAGGVARPPSRSVRSDAGRASEPTGDPALHSGWGDAGLRRRGALGLTATQRARRSSSSRLVMR